MLTRPRLPRKVCSLQSAVGSWLADGGVGSSGWQLGSRQLGPQWGSRQFGGPQSLPTTANCHLPTELPTPICQPNWQLPVCQPNCQLPVCQPTADCQLATANWSRA